MVPSPIAGCRPIRETDGAHEFSTIYNSTTIRLDRLSVEGERVVLDTSRTTYFDSLLTNRSMDYVWTKGRSVREVYEPGPFLSPLDRSRMSNHLGFNGFVELNDGYIVFVVRRGNLSVGKNSLSTSVAASMKASFCLDADRRLTVDGISSAIQKETWDELGIDLDSPVPLAESIFAFYRDATEGGKPQFLFYVRDTGTSKAQFLELHRGRVSDGRGLSPKDGECPRTGSWHVASVVCGRRRRKRDVVTDGDQFVFVKTEDLHKCRITAGTFTTPEGRRYNMMPTATGATVLLMRFLGITGD